MGIVVGTTTRTRAIGFIASECGLCRCVTRQRVLAREGRDHVMSVSVDRSCAHLRECLGCGNTTAADLRRQTVVTDPRASSWPLRALADATYPQAREAEERYAALVRGSSEGDAEARQALLEAAFGAVEWSAEVQSPHLTPAHRFFQVAGPLVLSGVGLWHIANHADDVTEAVIGLVMAAVGGVIAALIVELRMSRPRRLARCTLVPVLVRALASLRPSEAELARALGPFAARQSALADLTSPSSLARALSTDEDPPSGTTTPATLS